MSDTRAAQSLLKPDANHATMDARVTVELDLSTLTQLERMLTPFLNEVRRAQGKRPVIVPKG